MEKTTKLSLKRKTIGKHKFEYQAPPILLAVENNGVTSAATSTVLSSDHPYVPTEAVDAESSLGKLKNLLLRISSQAAVPNSCRPFSDYNPKKDNPVCIHQRDVTTHVPGNTNKLEFSPFPKLCGHYILQRLHCKHSENVVISNNGTTTSSSEKNGITTEQKHDPVKGKTDSDEFVAENCSIIRDRNSNLYSLQTKNNLLTTTPHRPNESKSVRLKDSSPDLKRRKVCNVDDTNANSGNPLRNRHAAVSLNIGSRHKMTENILQTDNIRVNVAGYQTEILPGEENHKMPGLIGQSSVATNRITVRHSPARESRLPNQEVQGTCNVKRANKQCSNQDRNEVVVKENTVPLGNATKQTTLTSCPLCQHTFDPSFGQVEKDSHIAQCLSMSDDVVW